MLVEETWPIKVQSLNWWNKGLTSYQRRWKSAVGTRQKEKAKLMTLALLKRRRPSAPVVVTLTRVAPRKLDDDNLTGGFKHIRDGVALAIQMDDKPGSGVTWQCNQIKGDPKEYVMRISIAW